MEDDPSSIVAPISGSTSAYSGKAAVAYGEFQISGKTINEAPLEAASVILRVAVSMLVDLEEVTGNWRHATRFPTFSVVAVVVDDILNC